MNHPLIGPNRNRTVVALGVLFNFNANDKGTFVQSVTDMIKESWVRTKLPYGVLRNYWLDYACSSKMHSRRILMFSYLPGSSLLHETTLWYTNCSRFSHMPVQGQGSEWEAIRQEIRKSHPTTPVLIFGGMVIPDSFPTILILYFTY